MFISVLDLFKIGIGPSSSHTLGPMLAALHARERFAAIADLVAAGRAGGNPDSHDDDSETSSQPDAGEAHRNDSLTQNFGVRCTLKGSLAFTGRGHATDRAVILGLHGYRPQDVVDANLDALITAASQRGAITLPPSWQIGFVPERDIVFDRGPALATHPNGMRFDLLDQRGERVASHTYFSIGGGFVTTPDGPINAGPERPVTVPYGFDSAASMLAMAARSGVSVAAMKRANEHQRHAPGALDDGLDAIWQAMRTCLERGLAASGELPGGLAVQRRARQLYADVCADRPQADVTDWLCAYAMAVNEENAAGHLVVTAPTNGAAGVIPAVLYYLVCHANADRAAIHTFLLTAAAIGGLIKHRSSISGAEVGCQGEVGSASAMAAAGACAVRGGSPAQVEHAAEIALEHHLGMTCDPINGLVQVPCIERNGFGAIKAYAAASLALRGSGSHRVPLDSCIAAMDETGQAMSTRFKETALGGLAVNVPDC